MSLEVLLSLLIFIAVGSITPGPNNIMLLASGMNYGVLRTVPHLFGIWVGFPLMILLVGLGLAKLFDIYPASLLVLKIISTFYLLYLAWKIATAAPPKLNSSEIENQSKPLTFLEAAVFQWVNPKGWTMALTAISLYTPPDHPVSSIFLVTFIFFCVSIPSAGIWVILGHKLRSLIADEKKIRLFNLICAGLLVASLYPIVFS